jgi:hypothetical protein
MFTRVALSPERLVGLIQRLLPRQAEVEESVGVVGEIAQYRALPLPRPQAKPSAPSGAGCGTQVFLMKLHALAGWPHDQGGHRQAPEVVKCCFSAFP